MIKSIWFSAALCLCLFFAAFTTGAADEPGIRTLDSIKHSYGPVKFDHPKHVSLSGNCSACHHEHGIADGLPCKQCHAVTPETFKRSVSHGFMACKNCHGDFDRDQASMPGLKTAYHQQCFKCHRGMGNIGSDPKGCAELCHAKAADKVGMKTAK